MKTSLPGIVTGIVLLCAVARAQDGSAPPTGTAPLSGPAAQSTAAPGRASMAGRITPGTVIPVELTKTIDAKKAKTGDEVSAKVKQDLKDGNGEIVVSRDTKITGHLTTVEERNKEQRESQVGIAFDHAILKNGEQLSLPMSIQAIISPETLNSTNETAGGEGTSQPPPTSRGNDMPGNNGAPSTGMGPGMPQPSVPTAQGESTGSNGAHQPITEKTQGVVGFSNLKLSTAGNPPQGSVISSEKGNVKLDSGTLMLLKVNQ
jgi:hypothetical protein